MKRALQLVLLTSVAFGPFAMAKKHPVPLEKNTDAAKCVSCHENKSKGKVVHSAMAKGCANCHEVRVNKDVTRVKLTQVTPSKLCFACHSKMSPAETQGHAHPPNVRDCTKCHDSHTSANKNQLLKTTSGNKDQNLCLACHNTGLNVPEKGSRHAVLDRGCESCHVIHKTGDPANREFRSHLTKDSPALCLECHDPKAGKMCKGPQNQPLAKTDCLTCHDPHQSKSPKLMQAFLHNPFESKSCETCHQESKDGKVVLTQASVKELCLTCHSEKSEQIEKAKVQHPGAAGDCTDCHNPHAGKAQGFPKPDAVNVCLGCHADQAEQHKKKHLHQPVFEQGCAICHEPHGSDNPKLLRAKSINGICLECHGPDTKPERLESEHLLTIFGGKVKLPENYFNKVVRLPIKYGLGHPVDRHPVKDQMQPEDVTKVRVAINCATCHQPHASANPDLLVKDQVNNMMFCASCHKNLGG